MASSPGFKVASARLKKLCLPPLDTRIWLASYSRPLSRLNYQNLVGFVFQTVVAFELRNDRFFQSWRTINGGVLGLAVGNGFNGGLFDVLWGVEVRLTCAQANNILASSAKLCCFVGNGEGWRWLDSLYTAGKLKVQT